MGGSGASAARLTGQKTLESGHGHRGREEGWGVVVGSGRWAGELGKGTTDVLNLERKRRCGGSNRMKLQRRVS